MQQEERIILSYWLNKLARSQNEGKPNANDKKEQKGLYAYEVEPAFVVGVQQLAKGNAIAEYTVYLSLFGALLKKYTNNANIWIASPDIQHSESQPIAEALLVYDLDLCNDQTVKEVINITKSEIQSTLPYNNIAFAELVKHAAAANIDTSHFLQYGFSYSPLQDSTLMKDTVKLSLNLEMNDDQKLSIIIRYDKGLYSDLFIKNLAGHYSNLLLSIRELLDQQLGKISVVSNEEKAMLMNFAGTFDLHKNGSVISHFQHQVQEHPDQAAVICRDRILSYAMLDRESDKLASVLKERYNTVPGDFVGVMTNYSELTIIAFLAALKAGAAYVPLDPSMPAERLKFILEDIAPKTLLIHSDYFDNVVLSQLPVYTLDLELNDEPGYTADPFSGCEGDSIAHVMYTSGSTGKPKGVLIRNKGIVRLVKDTPYIVFTPEDKILGVSSFAFDGSTFDIWGALLNGATLIIPQKDLFLDYQFFAEIVERNGITAMLVTTALFNSLVDNAIHCFKGLRKVLSGGEAVSPKHVKRFFDEYGAGKFIHLYGPTENTTNSTYYPVDSEPLEGNTIPIGKPLPYSQCYVLDEYMQLQPVGVSGELYVGGEGLAQGYWNRSELSAERFVDNPFRKEDKIYKTGDKVKWLDNGTLEFIARMDDQVKIRGYRVELGEIETHILSYQGIKEVTVVATTDKDNIKVLAAYLVAENGTEITALRAALQKSLPAYMVPADFIIVPSFPLTVNGKVDKKALQGIRSTGAKPESRLLPADETEEKLLKIWKELLERDNISTNDIFFDIGGHSLKATQLVSRIHKEMSIKLELRSIFVHQTIQQLSAFIKTQQHREFESISVLPSKECYDLSSSQLRLWLLGQLEEGNVAYNMPGVYIFKGKLNKPALEKAFLLLIERHEILRTVFREDIHGEIKQYIRSTGQINFKIIHSDLRREKQQQQLVSDIIKTEALKQFDHAEGPLLRAKLLETGDDQYVFAFTMHHIISDGWSMGIMIRELFELYDAVITGTSGSLRPLRIQYKDYAAWQQKQLSSDKLNVHRDYWLKQFEGEIPVLEMPADFARPPVKTFNGGSVSATFNAALTAGLNAYNQAKGGTLFMTLLSLLNAMLHRYSSQVDIIIGTPIAGREHIDLEDQIGFYINTLGLRTRLSEKESFSSLFEKVKQITLDGYAHQAYPFDELVNELQLNRDLSRTPLFDVMLVLQNSTSISSIKSIRSSEGEISISKLNDAEYVLSKFDLTFDFADLNDTLQLSLGYNSDLYSHETAQRIARHFETLCRSAISDPGKPIAELDYIDPEECHLLLEDFNATAHSYPEKETLLSLFEKQAGARGNETVLIFKGKTFTYKQLNEKANSLGAYLRQKYGVKADDLIAIKLERSEWMIISVLGVLKSGAGYVPIDPGYPDERIAYMLEDSKCKALIDAAELELFFNEEEKYSTENPVQIVAPENLAYVIYTSGSTGKPKGCMLEHKGVINRIEWMWNQYAYNASDIILQKTAFTFDVSVWEIFMPLCWGVKMVLCEKEDAGSPQRILNLISHHKITCLHFVPSLLNAFISDLFDDDSNKSLLGSLTKVITSGEALPASTVKQWYAFTSCPVHNLYGPTEASVDVTHYTTKAGDVRIPIGSPIWNTRIYILNEQQQLCPIGVNGEIYIGGDGLARGYINNQKLTDEKFVKDPFIKGERVYRTGDLGRWLSNGVVEYTGRIDHQVKVRGYRIELGEIENSIQQHDAVDTAIVLAREDRDQEKSLVAYYVPSAISAYTLHKIAEQRAKKISDGIELFEMPDGLSMYAYNKAEVYFLHDEIFRGKIYLKNGIVIPDGGCVFDVGANLGMFSVFAGMMAKNVAVYSFEPLPPIFRLLSLNTSLYKANIHTFDYGLSDKNENVSFTYYPNATVLSGRYPDSSEVNETVKNFIYNTESDSIDKIEGDDLQELLDDRLKTEIYECRLKTISSVITDNKITCIDLLKIDVEKGELDVLKGIDPADWKKIRQIVIEVHDVRDRLSEIKTMLVANGFKVLVDQSPDMINTGLYDIYAVAENCRENAGTPLSAEEGSPVLWTGKKQLRQAIRNSLRSKLPEYMVPAHYIELEQMPLSANGKVDRKVLASIKSDDGFHQAEYVPPGSIIEEQVAAIWKEILSAERVGIRDNFFELGGTSLKIIKLSKMLKKVLNRDISVVSLFQYPTIRDFVNHLQNESGNNFAAEEVDVEEINDVLDVFENE